MGSPVKTSPFTLALLFLTIFTIQQTDAANFLFILPIGTRSHMNVFNPIILGLAANSSHQVTVLNPFPAKFKLPSNVHEIVPVTRGSFKDDFSLNPLEMRQMGMHRNVLFFGSDMTSNCEQVYSHPEVKKLLGQQFDLIFINGYFNQCFWGLVPYFNAPFVLVTTMASPLFLTLNTGNYYPLSFVPLPFLDVSDKMNFLDRIWNFVASYWVVLMNERKVGINEGMYRKHLGASLPSLREIGLNVSLIMSNEHFAVTYPRPNFVDTIPIGGIHCRPAKPIADQDLANFLSDAPQGFMYFSFGSIMESNHLPDTTINIFLDVFSRLKQRVIWKWENESMANVPSNVRISKWVPQQDILGHPNIKLFITHGGLLSTYEAAYHGVPLLGMPVIVDQDLNIKHAQKQGYALKLEILEITTENFESSIQRMLNEPSFTNRAKELSLSFKDQMETPLERALYWAEYLVRHKGAPHLRSAARQLNIFQIHSLDVLAFLTTITALVLYILYRAAAKLFKIITGKSSTTKPKQKKQ